MPGFEVQVEGLAGVRAKLESLKPKVAKTISNRAFRAGAAVFKAELEQNAPERPNLPSGTALPVGALRAYIEVHTIRQSGQPSDTVTIGPGKYTAYAARFVEYGHDQTRNTSIAVGTKGFKGSGRKGKKTASVVSHVEAHPFLRPAYEHGWQPALDAIVESYKKDLANVNAVGEES